MGISVKEPKKLDDSGYQIIDIRDPIEIAHGTIAGAVAIKPEEIEENVNLGVDRRTDTCYTLYNLTT